MMNFVQSSKLSKPQPSERLDLTLVVLDQLTSQHHNIDSTTNQTAFLTPHQCTLGQNGGSHGHIQLRLKSIVLSFK